VNHRVKSLWIRWVFHGARYGVGRRAFEVLYAVSDPWRMTSAREKYRFEQTNRIIEEEIGRSRTLLEIGCGEGHQTAHLVKLADRVHAVDISKMAITRARAAVPRASFDVADLFTCPRLADGSKYDLAVACEILYYIEDVESALVKLNELGRHCLVTYFQRETAQLDPLLARVPGMQSRMIEHDGLGWKVVWWSSDVARTSALPHTG
jgi:2-polyprenyl-3-methyl-5-hydroxy-6-metoxy-1,4-benzoquinol methylase